MKKRILSILLAAMMLVTIFVMPTSVSAAGAPSYSWNGFEADDVRTHRADLGQIIDLGAKGGVATAPTMDGKLTSGEYNLATTVVKLKDTSITMPAYFAAKDGYLYVAIDSSDFVTSANFKGVQFELGVASSYTSESTWNRLSVGINKADNGGSLVATRGPSADITGGTGYSKENNVLRNERFIVDYYSDYETGIHEIKVDIGMVYKTMANLAGGQNAWNSPCMAFSCWVNDGSFQHFSLPAVGNSYKNVGRAVDWVSYTVILPQNVFNTAAANYKGIVGPLGYDWRNAVEGQMVTLTKEAAVAPTVDGIVGANEYADGVSTVINHNFQTTTYGAVTANYAVKDGWFYGTMSYAETTPAKAHFQFGLNPNSGQMVYGRNTYVLNTNGTYSGNSGMYKWVWQPSLWMGDTGTPGKVFCGYGDGATQPLYKAAFKNDGSTTTIEFQFSIVALTANVEAAGWNVSESNCVKFMVWPGQKDMLGWKGWDSSVTEQIQQYCGYSFAPSYVCPTVQLPRGYVDTHYWGNYVASDVNDFEASGQLHSQTLPATANLDGVIDAGEYTASESYDGLRSADTTPTPDLAISGTNYFAYDAEYLYFGAQVKDANYKSGTSAFQLNLAVPTAHLDGKFDLGDGVTRINTMIKVRDDGTTTWDAFSNITRSQNKDAGGNYIGASEFTERVKANMTCDVVGSYDETNQIITYEVRIPLSALKATFLVDDISSITYLHYVVPGSGTPGWNLYKLPAVDHMQSVVRIQSAYDNGALVYTNNFYGNVIDFVDYGTKDGASVRITSISKQKGIRFKTTFTDAYIAEMKAYAAEKGEDLVIGTLIAPKAYVDSVDAFTKEALEAAYAYNPYVDILATIEKPYASANGITTYAASIVGVKDVEREYAAIGYVQVGDEIFYSNTYTVRSQATVAAAALADVKDAKQPGYIYQLDTGKWSPYSQGWYDLIEEMLA